jgi:hypothetical protein
MLGHHFLGIKVLGMYSSLTNLISFVPDFPEILSKHLIFSECVVLFIISALDGTWSAFARNLLLVCYPYFNTRGQFNLKFVSNTLLVCCSELTRKLPTDSSLSFGPE